MSKQNHGRNGTMANHINGSPDNLWEYLVSILFSIASLAWAHFTNTDGLFFKIVVAPAVAGSVGYFVVKFWKWLLKDNS
jgi:hypothetical protein